MRTVALHLASLSLVFAPVLLHAVETRSTSLNVSLDASVCTALPKGGCNTCDACCADYSESECADCVAAECSGYRCVGVGDALCNVCDTCCNKPWLVTQHACDACVYATCDVLADICHERGTMENPVQCSSKCWGDCVWSWPPTLKAPCLEACIASPTFLLVCAVFALRMLESLWCGIKRGLCGLKRNKITQFRTCIDRPYVQLEVRTAKSSGKPILTVFEEDTRRQGFFDYTLAWEKYGETEWKFLLNIDSVTYRRDAFEAQAMCKRLLRKAQKAVPSGAPNPAVQPLNEPGHWDFFLSHGQAAAGDQVKTLCFLLRQAGKTVWYDNEMQCRDTAAMQEGVLNSDCFLLFLSGDPHVVHGSTAHRERTSCQKSPCSLCCNEQSGDGEYSALHSEDHASQLERGDTTSETETAAFAEPVPVEDSYFVVQQTDTVELTDRQRESWIGLRRGAAHFFRNHEPWYKTGGVSYHNSAEMQDRVKAEGEANGVRVVAVEETDAWIQIDNERWLPKNFGLQPLLTRGESEDKWIVDLPDDWPIEVLPYHRNPSWTDPVVITGVSYGARVRAVYQTAKWIQTLDGHWLPKKILKRFDMEAIGQVVWVRDNYGEPWMRGAVMAHDETSFAPLVRPVVKIKGLDGDYRDIFWGDEERAWQHLDVPAYPSTSVGQVVWVKDDEWIPWIHGLVEAHDKVSGAPLVRPVAGRSKALSGGYFAAKWSEEDSLTLHAWHFVTTRPPGYEFGKLTSSDSSWSEAIVDNGLSPHGALARGLVKALFWHLLQPCLYFYVYFDAHLSLEPVQRGFGNAVAVREAIYLLSSLACICVNPAFLLVDYSAPQGALFFAAMYTIAPEKYVALALLDKGGLDKQCLLHMLVFGGPVLDACGLAALGAGIGEGNLPLALAVGYSVTTLIWPVAITALVWLGIKKSVEEWDMSIGPRPLLGALGMIAFVFPLAFLLALASAAGSPMAPTGWSTTTSIVILSALVMLCGCGCEFWMRTFAYDDASKAFGQCCGLCFLLFFLASLSVVVDWIETATLSVCLMVYCFCLYVSGVRTDDTDKKVWGLCCGLLFLVLLVLAIVMRAEAAEASGSSSSDSAEEHSIISTTLVLLVPLLLLPLGRCLCRLDATKRMAAQQSAQQSAQLQAEKCLQHGFEVVGIPYASMNTLYERKGDFNGFPLYLAGATDGLQPGLYYHTKRNTWIFTHAFTKDEANKGRGCSRILATTGVVPCGKQRWSCYVDSEFRYAWQDRPVTVTALSNAKMNFALKKAKRATQEIPPTFATQQQLADTVAVSIESLLSIPTYNSVYAPAGEHDGWPWFKSEEGIYLYLHQPHNGLPAWILNDELTLDRASGIACVCTTPAGELPVGKQAWTRVWDEIWDGVQSGIWDGDLKEQPLTVTLLYTEGEVVEQTERLRQLRERLLQEQTAAVQQVDYPAIVTHVVHALTAVCATHACFPWPVC